MPWARQTVEEVIEIAIDNHDARAAGRVVDHLRFKHGYTYSQVLDQVKAVRPNVTQAQWDALLAEADEDE